MKKRPAIELRLIVNRDEGLPLRLESTQETLCVSNEVIADSNDILSARVEKSRWDHQVVAILLDFHSAAKLKSLTTKTHGLRIGLIVDGTLFAAPFVHGEISDVMELSLGNLSDDALEIFADTMTAFRSVQ